MEWSGGSETFGEALAKIHQREEAAVRRERAMAYAFSHQVHQILILSWISLLTKTNLIICTYPCSGGPTRIQILDQAITKLVNQIGGGAGWTAGLLLGLGKAELRLRKVQRKHKMASQTRL